MGSDDGGQAQGDIAVEDGAPRIYELLVSESKQIASQLRWGGFRRLDLRTRGIASSRQAVEVLSAHTDAVVLDAGACEGDVFELCSELTAQCRQRCWRVGTPICAKFSRVWLEVEIGQAGGA